MLSLALRVRGSLREPQKAWPGSLFLREVLRKALHSFRMII